MNRGPAREIRRPGVLVQYPPVPQATYIRELAACGSLKTLFGGAGGISMIGRFGWETQSPVVCVFHHANAALLSTVSDGSAKTVHLWRFARTSLRPPVLKGRLREALMRS